VRDLPSGTVTFLFTDVEGSTRLLHELRDPYADELEPLERALLAETIEDTRRTLGDEFDGSWAAGTQLDLGKAVDVALDRLEPVEPRSA
jgi:class 3 adenylate cyclase